MMNVEFDSRTREQLVADGYNFAGSTDDLTMLSEIRRDYLASGYSEVVFVRANKKNPVLSAFYYTKHPTINP